MRTTATLLTNLLLCLPLCLWALDKDQEKSKSKNYTEIPTPAMIESISSKKSWVDNVEKTLPTLLCDKNQYFVQCFQVTENECVDFTKLLVRACLNNVSLALPQQMNNQQGEYWGQMVGRCTYDLYTKYMQEKKRQTPNCNVTSKNDDLPKPSQALP
jgi:Asp-tRNA(Asn)/Glu-tRNA(Gln) amidotransferase B subunit